MPAARIARPPNPLDVAAWAGPSRVEARAALGLPADAAVAVWHGRVALGIKGLDVLLDAWRRLTDARPGRDLRLVLVGTGQSAGEFRALLATGAYPGVHWHDAFVLDRAVLRGYLAAGDAYVLASRREGFPVALVEALAAGLPVVATDVSGARDVVETAPEPVGAVVPVGDAGALADALGALLDDPARARRMGAAARRHAEATFSLDAFGRALRAFLFGPG